MTISVSALSMLVITATIVTALAPLLFTVLFIRDLLKGKIW